MQCDPDCGMCCGIAPATEEEFALIRNYVKVKKITPVDQGITCPVYLNGTCGVYPVRPLACRLFGHVEKMSCPHGYNVNIPQEQADRLLRKAGPARRSVHELLPDFNLELTLARYTGRMELLKRFVEISGYDFSGLKKPTGV